MTASPSNPAALTMEQVEALEQKANAAVPGPWCEHPNGTSVWTGREYDSMALQRKADG